MEKLKAYRELPHSLYSDSPTVAILPLFLFMLFPLHTHAHTHIFPKPFAGKQQTSLFPKTWTFHYQPECSSRPKQFNITEYRYLTLSRHIPPIVLTIPSLSCLSPVSNPAHHPALVVTSLQSPLILKPSCFSWVFIALTFWKSISMSFKPQRYTVYVPYIWCHTLYAVQILCNLLSVQYLYSWFIQVETCTSTSCSRAQ